MSFWENLKIKLHKRVLRREMKRNAGVTRGSSPFGQAMKIGILFNASEQEQERMVMKYVERLRNKHKKRVSVLGFYDSKEDRTFDLFKNYSLNDLDWKMIPKNGDVKLFMDNEFDIVINFFDKPYIHGDYIMAMSKAKLRVGRNSNNTDAYELIINEKQKDSTHFIGLLDTYLKTFNQEPNEPKPV